MVEAFVEYRGMIASRLKLCRVVNQHSRSNSEVMWHYTMLLHSGGLFMHVAWQALRCCASI
jgi:hypothetical protein